MKINIQKLFSFKGRIHRRQFLKAFFYSYMLIFFNFFGPFFSATKDNILWLKALSILIFIFIAIFYIAALSRRLHDFNVSALWILIIPILDYICTKFFGIPMVISTFVAMFLSLKPGNEGPNKYGDDPLK